MRQLLIAVAFVLVIITGCVYIRVFPAAPDPGKVQPPPTATFNAVPDVVPATPNQPVINSFTAQPQGERVSALNLVPGRKRVIDKKLGKLH